MSSKNNKLSIINNKYLLTIGWLYPDLMSTYGDRGNIIVLKKRAEWRGIKTKIEQISLTSHFSTLNSCNLLFMGGAQDTQQEIVSRDLQHAKGQTLASRIESGIPGLFICGAYQFLGKYYRTADGKKLPGLGVFPLYTENPGGRAKRLIGNIAIEINDERLRIKENIHHSSIINHKSLIVGFENHGGRTYLENKNLALGTVMSGFGNNGEDKTEGIAYKNSIGTYLHGPILPKNPTLADHLILSALEHKYKRRFHLKPLDDSIEQKARHTIISKLGI